MLAAQLLRLPGKRRVLVIEPRAELGRGEAYSAVELGHTLNGNAARMSVDPDNADDLTQWLTDYIGAGGWPESDEQHVPISELFPPRGIFGLYVQQRLAEAQGAGRVDGSTVEHVRAEVVDLQTDADSVLLTLSDGQQLQRRFAVLATGMFPAARTPQTESSGLNAAALDPWDVQAMTPARPAVDGADHRLGPDHGRCRGVPGTGRASRADRGVFPPRPAAPCAAATAGLGGFSGRGSQHSHPSTVGARSASALPRSRIAQGIDWQAPLDTVRAHIGRLWSQASERERRQFVRHVRPWWESHHHRSPPLSAELVARLHEEGRLRIQAASFKGLGAFAARA